MRGLILDDIRRIVLGCLFVTAFGWMAAQVLPGTIPPPEQQIARS